VERVLRSRSQRAYRTDIDVLRAIAVLGVVLTHASVPKLNREGRVDIFMFRIGLVAYTGER
jgi:peptidoglycan/LPS O-acetylase OafA/YrhL